METNNSSDSLTSTNTAHDFLITSKLTIPPIPQTENFDLHSFYQKTFKELASFLILNTRLHIPQNRIFTFVELEFYLKDEKNDHCDSYTHGHEQQLTAGEWYFHHVGKVGYRGGSRKGVDITFGSRDRNIYGGILVRSIKDYWSNQIVEGPCLVVETILDSCGYRENGGIKEMVEVCWENKLGIIKDYPNFNGKVFLTMDDESTKVEPPEPANTRRWYKRRKVDDVEVPLSYYKRKKMKLQEEEKKVQKELTWNRSSFNLKSTYVVYESPRVGLTLSNAFPSHEARLNYILKSYRFFILPHLLRKGKAQAILGLHDQFNDIGKVAEILKVNQQVVINHIRELSWGLNFAGDIKTFFGKKEKSQNGLEYCRMAGAIRKWASGK
ncbi:hypothetical protein Glove_162g82 [Diversispora epigaea]|uniref:Uncharacterized protein n=1 Tax=Diversispora epigaea TaxID=1348612 RepID=A0A397IUZ4_9GLOM|nr:hypothetical protein Glove_162g82 [Diversispora epigaea]